MVVRKQGGEGEGVHFGYVSALRVAWLSSPSGTNTNQVGLLLLRLRSSVRLTGKSALSVDKLGLEAHNLKGRGHTRN